MTVFKLSLRKVSSEQLFMGSVLLVNGGNYLYNLLLGRIMGPEAFAEAALLVTLLLVLSFIGMTFQLTCAKFGVLFTGTQWKAFKTKITSYALWFGVLVGLLLIGFAKQLQLLFNTEGYSMFILFGLGVPFYFFMSINRGTFQGQLDFKKLSITYQTEMWSRLLITMALLLWSPMNPGLMVAIGIFLSFLLGLFPSTFKGFSLKNQEVLTSENSKQVATFILLTAGYELTQIIINNSDVLMVKHYFDSLNAGLYATLALIGRVVYFVAWMFVMLLLPTVVKKQKEGEATTPILFKYVSYIGVLSGGIVIMCYLFPDLIIGLMFGDAYISIASLLWQYALVTSLFAISNVFAYYFLSLDHYIPVIISGLLGMSQVFLIVFFHESLEMVVQMQLIAMIVLLVTQVLYFLYKNQLHKKKHT